MLTSDAKWIIQHKPQMTRERRLQCERTTGPLRPPLFQRGFVVTVPAAKMTRHSVSLGAAQPLVQQRVINPHSSWNQSTKKAQMCDPRKVVGKWVALVQWPTPTQIWGGNPTQIYHSQLQPNKIHVLVITKVAMDSRINGGEKSKYTHKKNNF